MAMAMEPMLAAQLGKLGLAPGLLEVPNSVVEWLTFNQLSHYAKGFLDNRCDNLEPVKKISPADLDADSYRPITEPSYWMLLGL